MYFVLLCFYYIPGMLISIFGLYCYSSVCSPDIDRRRNEPLLLSITTNHQGDRLAIPPPRTRRLLTDANQDILIVVSELQDACIPSATSCWRLNLALSLANILTPLIAFLQQEVVVMYGA